MTTAPSETGPRLDAPRATIPRSAGRVRRTLVLALAAVGCTGLAAAVFVRGGIWPDRGLPRAPRGGPAAGASIGPGAASGDFDPASLAPADRVVWARRDGVEGLDRFIESWKAHCDALQADPDAAAARKGEALVVLAMAYGERNSARNAGRGIEVGKPLYVEVPDEVEADVAAGLTALEQARALGFESSEMYRIEALLLSCRVIGLTSALRWNGRIKTCMDKAFELDPDNPRAHVGQAVREILTPAWLGQDLEAALDRLVPAAAALPLDERPLVFAAMAAYMLDRRDRALELLQQAEARNPAARFAAVVAERIRAGEDDPFARDVRDGAGH